MDAVDFLGKVFSTFTAVLGSEYCMDAAEFVDKICSTFTAVLGSIDSMDVAEFVDKNGIFCCRKCRKSGGDFAHEINQSGILLLVGILLLLLLQLITDLVLLLFLSLVRGIFGKEHIKNAFRISSKLL